jgi:hypothetical protein|nr:MAG TPA: hypothetical protein [Caudoviricetes sp.]
MKAYAVNIIWTDLEEAAEHYTNIFLDLNEARKFCLDSEKEWVYNKQDCLIDDSPDVTDEQIEEWKTRSLEEDIDNDDAIYKHYIYGDGQEKIFELTSNEVENIGVFVVKEDYRYMNNQCEIGSNIHLITTDFKKAYDKAIEVRNKAQKEFGQSNYKDEEKLNSNEKIYSYSLQDDYDLIEITIERYEVE